MVNRLIKPAGILLAAGLLQVAITSTAVSQQTGRGIPAYQSPREYSAAPREVLMPSRNLGDVFSGCRAKHRAFGC
jgi:hypothetical protein